MADIVGYITGSFDIIHSDHHRLLQSCKQQCDVLIVGLVTDTLGLKQKRLPIFTYEERRTALEATKWVNTVVEHNGESKSLAYQKLRFDILFSGDEYLGSDEFKEFHATCPTVKVVYFPRNHDTSTSQIWQRIQTRIRNEDDEKVISIGVGGLIMQRGGRIVKHCNVSTAEMIAFDDMKDFSSDILGFMSIAEGKLPRNWRDNSQQLTDVPFPMITGINVFREVAVGQMFPNASWNTYVSNNIIYRDAKTRQAQPYNGNKQLLDFAHWVELERRFPAAIITITQKHGGITLLKYLQSIADPTTLSQKLREVIIIIRTICDELKDAHVVHGDIHGQNLLVRETPDNKLNISLIDFGWCSSLRFKLCDIERTQTKAALRDDSDYTHFLSSLQLDDARLQDSELSKLIIESK